MPLYATEEERQISFTKGKKWKDAVLEALADLANMLYAQNETEQIAAHPYIWRAEVLHALREMVTNGFNPASPGPIGQTIPDSGNFTGLTISGTTTFGPASAFSYASQAAIESQLTALGIPLNNIVTDATTARSLVLADAHKYITFTNAGAITLTVPANASVPFAIGTEIYIRRGSAAGAITLSNAGVTVNGFAIAPTVAANGNFCLKKKSTDEWDLI